jgi:hypothetical protein
MKRTKQRTSVVERLRNGKKKKKKFSIEFQRPFTLDHYIKRNKYYNSIQFNSIKFFILTC